MDRSAFDRRLKTIYEKHEKFVSAPNQIDTDWDHGLLNRYVNPVVTYKHIPPHWRFDLSFEDNPYLMERQGVNATLNPGAMIFNGKVVLMVRTEGYDRKSFFAVAESENGIDNFRFWDKPVVMPETDDPDTNVYDMRLVQHEDGWIYGLFCTERKDPSAPKGDLSSATAQCGIARTKDLVEWERLPDLKSQSAQQRNVVLHPEFVNGKYAFYTRPQDGFIDAGSGGGIGWGLADDITNATLGEEIIIDQRAYHTIMEQKNGLGPAPIKTDKGWLHLAHGVRGCAAGLRYVLYAFLCDKDDPSKQIARPGGHLLGPLGEERIGDVSNVLFSNGWVCKPDGTILLYYASSDTRCHVATTTVDKMLDYVLNSPADPGRTYACVQERIKLIEKNEKIMGGLGLKQAR